MFKKTDILETTNYKMEPKEWFRTFSGSIMIKFDSVWIWIRDFMSNFEFFKVESKNPSELTRQQHSVESTILFKFLITYTSFYFACLNAANFSFELNKCWPTKTIEKKWSAIYGLSNKQCCNKLTLTFLLECNLKSFF